MNDQNTFAGAFVERHAHLRSDESWQSAALSDDQSRFVLVWGDRCMAAGEPSSAVLLDRHQTAPYVQPDSLIFLGMYRDRPVFAVGVERHSRDEAPPFPELGEFQDLRVLGSTLPADQANLVAHARALVIWHRTQRFCGHCGQPTRAESGGNSRLCSSEACGRRLFPRVDPAIIVLVHDRDHCLLGRQTSWPEGRYSTIAGFVEPGESLEDAVAREVHEETDVRVGAVRYHSSQPWPFPSSLMLGFTADARSSAISLNDGELEDAQWFSAKEVQSGYPKLPPRLSIARRLIEDWLRTFDGAGARLGD